MISGDSVKMGCAAFVFGVSELFQPDVHTLHIRRRFSGLSSKFLKVELRQMF